MRQRSVPRIPPGFVAHSGPARIVDRLGQLDYEARIDREDYESELGLLQAGWPRRAFEEIPGPLAGAGVRRPGRRRQGRRDPPRHACAGRAPVRHHARRRAQQL